MNDEAIDFENMSCYEIADEYGGHNPIFTVYSMNNGEDDALHQTLDDILLLVQDDEESAEGFSNLVSMTVGDMVSFNDMRFTRTA